MVVSLLATRTFYRDRDQSLYLSLSVKGEGWGKGTDGGEDEETQKNESFEGSFEEKEYQTLVEEV
ncbi:MAG TPA: hypothetical protein VEM15_05590 [Thermodesulfobacteriota bacterium]|nr:hypothetical protein [Thermodesulfobacteriota bacterium]